VVRSAFVQGGAILAATLIFSFSPACYSPSLEGAGGFSCEKAPKTCPEGYQCCPRKGADVCLPRGQCGGGGNKDQGQGKDQKPGKQDRGGAKQDRGGVKKDGKPPAPDKGTTAKACNYDYPVGATFETAARSFSAALDGAGNPHVFYATSAGAVYQAVRGSGWNKTIVTSGPVTGLASAADNAGTMHLAARLNLSGGSKDHFLHHYYRKAGTTKWLSASVITAAIASVDVSASGARINLGAAVYDSVNTFWKIVSASPFGGGYKYPSVRAFSKTATLMPSEVRVSTGSYRVAGVVSNGKSWDLWSDRLAGTKKEGFYSHKGGQFLAPMAIAAGSSDKIWVAFVETTSSYDGQLMVASWNPGAQGLSNKTPIPGANLTNPYSVSIALDASGQAHVVWLAKNSGSQRRLMWTRQKGLVWEPSRGLRLDNMHPRTHVVVDQKTRQVHITYGTVTGALYHTCRNP